MLLICLVTLLHHTGIYAYVILKDGVTDDEDSIKQDLKKLIKTQIGSFAVPNEILVTQTSYTSNTMMMSLV